MMTRKITTFLIVSILYEDYTHTKHRTFFRNLGNIFNHFQYYAFFFRSRTQSIQLQPHTCSTNSSTSLHMTTTFQIQKPEESVLYSTAGSEKNSIYFLCLIPPEIKQQTKFLNTLTSEVTDIFHIHTFTDPHEEQVLTAKDAWRWMLCYKQTVLFITVIPTVILLVTNQ